MADGPQRTEIKVGVHEGGGPLPGYLWNVLILDQAYQAAREFLDEDQYAHMANQFRELAKHEDPTHSSTLDLRPIEDFYELRDKGGILKKLNGNRSVRRRHRFCFAGRLNPCSCPATE
jgi:hypothetical protein